MIFLSKIAIEEGNSGDRMGQTGCFFRHGDSRWRQSSGFFDHPDLEMYISNLVILGYFYGSFFSICNIELPSWEIWGTRESRCPANRKRWRLYSKLWCLLVTPPKISKHPKMGMFTYQHGFSKRAV